MRGIDLTKDKVFQQFGEYKINQRSIPSVLGNRIASLLNEVHKDFKTEIIYDSFKDSNGNKYYNEERFTRMFTGSSIEIKRELQFDNYLNGDECECCGKKINGLNSNYLLCLDCDNYHETQGSVLEKLKWHEWQQTRENRKSREETTLYLDLFINWI